jgi:acetylornithine deacetylase
LEKDDAQLRQHTHPLLGPATLNVGVIHGGVQVNFVPDEAVIELDRRLLPGEEWDDVLAHYQRLLESLMREEPGLHVEMELPPMLQDWPFQSDERHPFVQLCQDVLRGLGRETAVCGVPFGSDASKFARIGIPTVLFGPGSIDQAHAAVEYVECAQVEEALRFYREAASRWGA